MNKSNRCGFGGSERGEGSNFTAKCKIDSKNVSGRKWEKKNSPENHPENWDQNVQITKEIKNNNHDVMENNNKLSRLNTQKKYNSNCGAEVHVPKKMVPEGKEKSCAVYP